MNDDNKIELDLYSGPFSLRTEHLSEIGNRAAVYRCGEILQPFGIRVKLVSEKYHEPRVFLYPADSEPELTPSTRLYTLPQLENLCEAIENGTIDLNRMNDT